MSMNKKEFRKNQIQKLQKLSKTWEKKLDELNLYKELFKTTEWEKADNVAITLSEDFELDTFPIISTAQQQNKKVLVQDLYSVETLAHVDTLCLDKTGTITEGKMSIQRVEALHPLYEKALLFHGTYTRPEISLL